MQLELGNFLCTAAALAAVVLAGCGSETPPEPAGKADTSGMRSLEAVPPSPSLPIDQTAPDVEPARAAPPSSIAVPAAAPSAALQTVYRPDDERPSHDDDALERVGIRRYESMRLVLYTDLPADEAATLPQFVDAMYDDLVDYFGDLPPARDGSDFQMTGYLMIDGDRFRQAGLLPDDLPPFHHGRHRGRRFWMRDQDYDYYRRHLLLHEATHCFMTLLPGSVGPDWYMEGMAEWFGTHRVDDDGVSFGVMPASPEATAGSGRITLVRQDVADGSFKSLDEVFALKPGEFLENNAYAWSWAVCYFLDTHPQYRDRFRTLGQPALRRRLAAEYDQRFATDAEAMALEWALFAHSLRYGFDLPSAAVVFRPGRPLADDGATVGVEAARGWQSSGVQLQAGRRYRIVADGRFTLADEPVPWVSEAGGIAFDYFDGRPLGRLLAAVVVDDRSNAPDPAGGLLSPVEIGREATIEAPAEGTLYFRINDSWDRLSDNRGELRVTIRPDAR